MRRWALLLLAMVLVMGACGDDDAAAGSTTAATTTTTADGGSAADTTQTSAAGTDTTVGTTQTTPALIPPGPPFIRNGESGAYVWALQVYLECAGFGPIDIDGVFGDGTAGSVEKAQVDEGKIATGDPDEETFAALSRACDVPRDIAFAAGATSATVAGNASDGDDEVFHLMVLEGQQMTVTADRGVAIAVAGADGEIHQGDASTDVVVDVAASQMYEIRVSAPTPTSFSLTVSVPALPEETTTTSVAAGGDGFYLATDGFNVVDFGASPEDTAAAIEALHTGLNVPLLDTDDSGWVTYEESHCAETAQTVTWEILWPSAVDFWSVFLKVYFYDEADPTFGGWSLDFGNQGDGEYPHPVELSTTHGLGIFDTLEDAAALGFTHGGYEELSVGTLDGYVVRIPDAPGTLFDGRVTQIAAGMWEICDPF